MIQARAAYVLDQIYNGVQSIESECERLALLIVEARREEYWKLRYPTAKHWMISVFGSVSAFRHLASLGDAYQNQPGVITEIGRHKAEALVRVIRNEGSLSDEWIEKAKHMKVEHIRDRVNDRYPSRQEPKTERKYIQNDIEKLSARLEFHRRQIPCLEEKIKKLKMRLENAAA